MAKTRFTDLPIYKAIQKSNLVPARQKKVLRKLKKIRDSEGLRYETIADNLVSVLEDVEWAKNYYYWSQMHRDSGL